MAFESTNAILGIRGMEQQKKNDRWSKLMDIANVLQNTAGLGADIWKTMSGRKWEDTNREDTQEHDITRMNLGLDLDKQLADKQAEIREAQAAGDHVRAKELMAEEARLREEQAARDFPRERTLRGISAGAESFDRSNDFLDLVEKFKEGARGTYWTVMLDPETQSQSVKFLRSPAETLAYFESQIALANTLTEQQRADVLNALKAWVANPTGDGGVPAPVNKEPVDIATLLASIQEIVAAARASNPGADIAPPMNPAQQILSDPQSTIPITAPYGAMGAAIAGRNWSDSDENDLAEELRDIRGNYNIPDAKTKQDIDSAVAALSAPGKLKSKEMFDAFVSFKKSLETLYKAVPRGR